MTSDSSDDLARKRRRKIRRFISTYRNKFVNISLVGLALSLFGVVSPRSVFIQCNDPFISHPYGKDTVSLSALLSISLLVPYAIMIMIEWMTHQDDRRWFALRTGLRRASQFFWSLVVGTLFLIFVVEMIKMSAGLPRPQFMAMCRPNLTSAMCYELWVEVQVSNCTNPLNLSLFRLIDSMKTFPSGHAAISIHSAIFMTVYMQKRLLLGWSRLLVPWLQMVWWSWSLVCCISRVADHKHFVMDVMMGGVMGVAAAYLTVVYLCNWFIDESSGDCSSSSAVASSPSPVSSKEHNGLWPQTTAPSLELGEPDGRGATPVRRLI